jgi:hypothetical protein
VFLLNLEDPDFYAINESTDGVTFDISKEDLIETLKDNGIIYIYSEKQEKNKPKLKDEHKITENEDEIKYVIKYPDGELKKYTDRALKKMRDIGNLKDEERIQFEIDKIHIGFQLSPRIKILDLDGNKIATTSTFCDKEILFENGYLKLCECKHEREVLDFFNGVISIFNILNVPFDFVHESETIDFADLIFKNGVIKEDVGFYVSRKATMRGVGYRALQVQIKDFFILLDTVDYIYESIKRSDVLSVGDIYIFLGYGRYYHFHKDYLLSFANTWMFIEATINLMWEKMMIDNSFSTKYLNNNSKNWTLQIKIDELLLKGLIDAKTATAAQKLRTMRNKVFHVSKDVSKRKIDRKVSEECVDLGLSLFYHNIDFLNSGYRISFDNLASDIERCIIQNPFD